MKADVQTIAEVILTVVVVVSIVSFVISYLGGMTNDALATQTSPVIDPNQVNAAYSSLMDSTTKLTTVPQVAIVVLIVGLFMGLLAVFRKND